MTCYVYAPVWRGHPHYLVIGERADSLGEKAGGASSRKAQSDPAALNVIRPQTVYEALNVEVDRSAAHWVRAVDINAFTESHLPRSWSSAESFGVPSDLSVHLHRFVDHEALGKVLGVHLEQCDLYVGLAAVAVELQLQRIGAATVDHHQVGRTAVADVATAALRLDEHVVPGRLAQCIDRIVRHRNKKGTFSLNVKTACGIF